MALPHISRDYTHSIVPFATALAQSKSVFGLDLGWLLKLFYRTLP
jgi:hypothetical protein